MAFGQVGSGWARSWIGLGSDCGPDLGSGLCFVSLVGVGLAGGAGATWELGWECGLGAGKRDLGQSWGFLFSVSQDILRLLPTRSCLGFVAIVPSAVMMPDLDQVHSRHLSHVCGYWQSREDRGNPHAGGPTAVVSQGRLLAAAVGVAAALVLSQARWVSAGLRASTTRPSLWLCRSVW